MGGAICNHLRLRACVEPEGWLTCEFQDCDLRGSSSTFTRCGLATNDSELVFPFCHADRFGINAAALQELLRRIERQEEDIFVMSTLKATAEANLFACVGPDGMDVGVPQEELVVRIIEVLGSDPGAVQGQDLYVSISNQDCRFSTGSKPSRGWSTSGTGEYGTMGSVHLTWNDQFSFVSGRGAHKSPLLLSVVRSDNTVIAEAEVCLPDLSDQRVCHQWCQLGPQWRLYLAVQFVSSPEELLYSHIAEFEARLLQLHKQLRTLTEEVSSLFPDDASWRSALGQEEPLETLGEPSGHLMDENSDVPTAEPAEEPPPLLADAA